MSEEKILENHWLCEPKEYVSPVTEKISKRAYIKAIIISLLMYITIRLVGVIGFVIILGIWYGIEQYIKSKKEVKNEAS